MNQGTIMVLEDDLVISQVIKKYLEKRGYIIISYETGKLGLQFLHESEDLPHLIISDIMMPEMNGIEFSKIVRSHSSLRDIPIIAITAMDENQIDEKIKNQFTKMLFKPFALKELEDEIQFILNKT